jgi:hypothetical protein
MMTAFGKHQVAFALIVALCAFVVSAGCRISFKHVREPDDNPICCDAQEWCRASQSIRQTNFSYGKPNAVVDAAGRVIGIPSKILMLDWRIKNHNVGEDTQWKLAQYMAANGLASTHVRINEYAALDEWRRLADNDRISPLWRYSVGATRTLAYTLTGRLFGRDSYNPYTDTIFIYSDIPALAMKQAALAHNVYKRSWPGTYAASQEFPIVAMHQSKRATNEVLNYMKNHGSFEEIGDACGVLYADYGRDWAYSTFPFFPPISCLVLVEGHCVGHLTRGPYLAAAKQPESEWTVSYIEVADNTPQAKKGWKFMTCRETTVAGGFFKFVDVTPHYNESAQFAMQPFPSPDFGQPQRFVSGQSWPNPTWTQSGVRLTRLPPIESFDLPEFPSPGGGPQSDPRTGAYSAYEPFLAD